MFSIAKEYIPVLGPLTGALIGASISLVTSIINNRIIRDREREKILTSKLEELYLDIINLQKVMAKINSEALTNIASGIGSASTQSNNQSSNTIDDLIFALSGKIKFKISIYFPGNKDELDFETLETEINKFLSSYLEFIFKNIQPSKPITVAIAAQEYKSTADIFSELNTKFEDMNKKIISIGINNIGEKHFQKPKKLVSAKKK